jgi:hypothetical protein
MFKTACTSICAAIAAVGSLSAQDNPPADIQKRAAVIVRAEANDDGQQIQTIEMATSDGGDVFTFAPSGGGMALSFGMGNPLEPSEFLLSDPGVQKELELVDSQREQIQQMNKEFGKEISSKIDGIVANPGADKRGIGEAIQEINKRKKERLAQILLPHQVDRLKQISLQQSVNQAGLGQALASKALMQELGIDEEQKSQLKKKAEELNKELEEKVAKLRSEMRDELLNELKPEQREKMKQLMGNQFEFENPPGMRMLGPRATRGGRVAPQEKGNH